jgi:hypothetical protein
MLLAHEERFRCIYADYRDRPCGDYAELLRRGEVTPPRGCRCRGVARASADGEVLGELAERSRALGHKLIGWLRHDEEYISYCEQCGARIYIRLAPPRTEDGEALADACPTGTS